MRLVRSASQPRALPLEALARIAFACALAAGPFAAPRAARADAIVRIRAETRIELDVRREGAAIAVRGAVRDDGGAPVASRSIAVTIRPQGGPAVHAELVRTDREGRFVTRATAPEDGYLVEATFDGDADLVGTSARVTLDPVRAHVVLVVELAGGSRVSLDTETHPVVVIASSASGGGSLPIQVTNEVGGEVASGTTASDGRVSLALPAALLGPPASGRLIVRTPGDPTRTAAQTEVPIVRYRETHLEWLDDAAELGSSTLLRGRLATAVGPLERRAVGIFVDGEHLGTRLTGTDGELAIPLDGALAAEGATSVEVEARFDSDAPWLASSVAPPRTLVVRRATRIVPVLALASGVLVLLGVWWLRRRPLAGASTPRPSLLPGVVGARPTVLLPQMRGVSGVVLHAATREPIADASVRCAGVATRTERDGTFSMEVPDGAHPLIVEAAGFEEVQHRIASPHRGEWRGARVHLESRRDLAHRALLDVMSQVVPGETATVATDRELLDIARGRGAAWPEIVELVEIVEQVVYGQTAPGREELDRVRTVAGRARAALAARVDSASRASL